MKVKCPHGIPSDYIHRKVTIQGEQYVVGGDYWHSPHQRCRADNLKRKEQNP